MFESGGLPECVSGLADGERIDVDTEDGCLDHVLADFGVGFPGLFESLPDPAGDLDQEAAVSAGGIEDGEVFELVEIIEPGVDGAIDECLDEWSRSEVGALVVSELSDGYECEGESGIGQRDFAWVVGDFSDVPFE